MGAADPPPPVLPPAPPPAQTAAEPVGPPPQPPGPRPADVWPWLALLGLLALAGLLVWLFAIRDRGHAGTGVPSVVGLQQQQAIAKLTHAGYGVKAIIEPAAKPRGIVVSQAPPAGARPPKGQMVSIHVSNGRPVRVETTTAATTVAQTTANAGGTTTSPPAAAAAVPDVGGQDVVTAAGAVEAAGFVAETLPVEQQGTAGAVVGQVPTPGTQAPAGSVVRLSVAVGAPRPQVQVPNVVGQKAAAARQALLEAKLTVKTQYRRGPAKQVGVVTAENPSPGSTLPAWTQVSIVVGQS